MNPPTHPDRTIPLHASNPACVFCHYDDAETVVIARRGNLRAQLDRYPATDGHTLLIPDRHIESVFELTPQEHLDLWGLLADTKRLLDTLHHPDGYNIGVNDGAAAGQTVRHCHVHLIPRRRGDVPEPRGGIRRMFPDDSYLHHDTTPPIRDLDQARR